MPTHGIKGHKKGTLMITHKELSIRRRKLKMTQEDLASQLGVAQATVARWEMGKMLPSTPVILNKALRLIELEMAIGKEEFSRLLSKLPDSDKEPLPEQARKGPDMILKNDEAKIREAVAAYPNATLAELCELVKDAGGRSVSRSTMQLQLKRLNLVTQRSKGNYKKGAKLL
jgi:transcriptional regulator with XRE-family HTH domain